VIGPQLGGGAHPARTDHIEDLNEDQVRQAQFLAEAGTVRLDGANAGSGAVAGGCCHGRVNPVVCNALPSPAKTLMMLVWAWSMLLNSGRQAARRGPMWRHCWRLNV